MDESEASEQQHHDATHRKIHSVEVLKAVLETVRTGVADNLKKSKEYFAAGSKEEQNDKMRSVHAMSKLLLDRIDEALKGE